eukprot:Selendium_serpulae@DN4826_c0_g1_i5.p4
MTNMNSNTSDHLSGSTSHSSLADRNRAGIERSRSYLLSMVLGVSEEWIAEHASDLEPELERLFHRECRKVIEKRCRTIDVSPKEPLPTSIDPTGQNESKTKRTNTHKP